jgi:hypothetical protein
MAMYFSEGWSLGRGLVFFFWVWTGRIIPSPTIYVHTSKGFCLSIRVADHLRSADCQVAPSGVMNPLRTSPEIPPGLLADVPCILKSPPSGGGPGRHTTERSGCCPLRRQHPTRYQCAWPLARHLPKIPPKIPATGMVEAA